MNNLGVVIVTWNSADQIGPCLASLRLHFSGPVVVVDNASADETLALLPPDVSVLANPENRGFAAAVNQGVRALSTPFLLILNPDCHLQSDPTPLLEAARDGASGGLLIASDGRPQRGFQFRRFPSPLTLACEVLGLNRLWPANPVNSRYRCLHVPIDAEIPVDQPAGAFLCFRRDAFETIGGFDESFWPVWFEDVDFCRRLARHGYVLRFTPRALARHAGARSIRKILWSSKELAWYGSLLRYATLQYGWLSRRLVGLAVAAASVPRAFTGILFRHQSAHALGVYARVFSLALGVVVLGRVDERRNPLRRGSALQSPGYFK